MSRFIESIQLNDGQLLHLDLHLARMERTAQAHYGSTIFFDRQLIEKAAKKYPQGLFKCRLIYAHQIEEITFTTYHIRPINSLRLVFSQLAYAFKYENRTELMNLFQQRGDCDDVIIVKDGLITDGSYTNLAFFDGTTWWTPSTPLLKGIQREVLLASEIIKEKRIPVTSLSDYKKVKLFNAMMGWEAAPEVVLSKVNLIIV